ncbi:MAG: TRAP transporter substrate-binding protein DctP [Chloroflexi bacterium]|nr:TRAP transporter substrate-binding protein DctP [Chloroflexota bacterium]
MIHDGFIVTNAHVVWPFDQARIVFPDGSEFLDVPVLAFDPMSDLAVLGPLDFQSDFLVLGDGEDLQIGSDLLLVGYPAESEDFPQPTITRGILSRIREWEALEMTYFQTDARITGGQSGGALISTSGEVIGVSGFRFSDAGFGLVGSASDVSTIVESMIAGEAALLGDRSLPAPGTRNEATVNINNYGDRRVFVIDEPVGTVVNLEIYGLVDGVFTLNDSDGFRVLLVDNTFDGLEKGSFEIEIDAPYFFKVGLATGDTGRIDVRSSSSIASFDDPDDGRKISPGETIMGSLDFPRDIDYFTIQLRKGQTVRIATESLNVDTILKIDFHGSRDNQVLFDNDGGGGLFGTDSEIIFEAPETDTYFISVWNDAVNSHGGYFLSVEPAKPGAVPAYLPPSPKFIESPFGTMIIDESPDYGFSIQVPADWIEVYLTEGLTLELSNPDGASILIAQEDVSYLRPSTDLLEEYTDLVESVILSISSGSEIISRRQIETSQGFKASLLEISILNGLFKGNRFVFVDENDVAFNITYSYPSELFDSAKGFIDYSIGSFLLAEKPVFNFTFSCINRTLDPCELLAAPGGMIDRVWERTNGQVQIQSSSFPELGLAGPDTLRLLGDGTLGMAELYSGYIGGDLPIVDVANLWGVIPDIDTNWRTIEAVREPLHKLLEERSNGVILGEMYYGNNLLYANDPLRTGADFDGLRIRSHSTILGDLITGLGADSRFVAFSEVYTAMDRGILDAAVTCGPCGAGVRWFEVADYLVGPIITIGVTYITVNKDRWNEMPEDLQVIMREEAQRHQELNRRLVEDVWDPAGIAENIAGGMEYIEFTPELVAALRQASIDVVIPNWVNRNGGPTSDAVKMFNDFVSPIIGVTIDANGKATAN